MLVKYMGAFHRKYLFTKVVYDKDLRAQLKENTEVVLETPPANNETTFTGAFFENIALLQQAIYDFKDEVDRRCGCKKGRLLIQPAHTYEGDCRYWRDDARQELLR